MLHSTRLLTSFFLMISIALTACDTTGTNVVASPSVSAAPATPATSTSTSVAAPAPAALPAATYAISGVVSGTAGANLALSGTAAAATTTDSNGNFNFASVAGGNYTVVPAQTGFIFSPASRAVLVTSASVTDVVFSGSASTAQTFTLSGTVTGSAVSGVVITLNGTNVASAVTDLGGNYTFAGLVAGTYTVSASLEGYAFTQPLIVALSTVDSASNDFTSAASPTGGALAFAAVAVLPQATVGKAYSNSAVLSITGGTAPYRYQSDTLDAGTPPLGMYVNPNGTITGTANVPGKYVFSVCAIDAVGDLATCSPTSLTVVTAVTAPTPTPTAAPTVTLAASPATLTLGANSMLTWSSTNAASCVASGGWTGNKETSGSTSVSPTSTTTYTLACSGSGGTGQTSAKVTVNPVVVTPSPAPTVSLTTSDATLTSGATATLTWSIKNATACTRSGGWTGTQTTSGSTTVLPLTTTTYTVSCTGTGGSAQASVKETVSAAASNPAPTATLSAADTTLNAGDSTTLTWSSNGATSCGATGGWTGNETLAGTKSVSPAATTTYTLTCTSSGGTVSASTRITVNAASVTPAPPAPPVASGTSWVYYNGSFDWPGDYSFQAVPDYNDTSGAPMSGGHDIKVTITGQWGGWLPYAQNWSFNSRPYTKLTFSLKPTVAGQVWNVFFVKVGDVPIGIYLDPTNYGPAPVVGKWATYTIPLADLGVLGDTIYKFCIHDETGLGSNVWYVDNVGFVP